MRSQLLLRGHRRAEFGGAAIGAERHRSQGGFAAEAALPEQMPRSSIQRACKDCHSDSFPPLSGRTDWTPPHSTHCCVTSAASNPATRRKTAPPRVHKLEAERVAATGREDSGRRRSRHRQRLQRLVSRVVAKRRATARRRLETRRWCECATAPPEAVWSCLSLNICNEVDTEARKAMIVSGFDKRLETVLVDWSPQWLTDLTARF
jgi:hypothetical protein